MKEEYKIKDIKDILKKHLKILEEYDDNTEIAISDNLSDLQEWDCVLVLWNTKIGEVYIDLDYPDGKWRN